MKTLLLLGGSTQQLPAITLARQQGVRTVLCDYLPDNPGRLVADVFHPVSTTDKEAVLHIARLEHIDGVVAYASDPAAETAAFVSEQLGLPGNSLASVTLLSRKHLFREFLTTHGFPCPPFASSDSCGKLGEEILNLPFPIMVKPDDSSGSKGVTKLSDPAGFEAAFEDAKRFSRNGIVVAESFLRKSGSLIGGDAFVVDGKIAFAFLGDQFNDPDGNPFVPAGMVFPTALSPDRQTLLLEMLDRLLGESGFRTGAINIEAIFDEAGTPFFIEIGPRNGGNGIPLLADHATGCSMVALTLEAALGRPVVPVWTESGDIHVYYAIHGQLEGRYGGIDIHADLRPHVLRLIPYREPGDRVQPFEHAGHAVGIVLLRFPSRQACAQWLPRLPEAVAVRILPQANPSPPREH